jgi:cyclic-di-GMP-binding protein
MPTVLQTAPFGRSGNLPRGERITDMASDSSFDVVSKVDRQEVDNAVNQTAKELSQRFDFRGTGASVAWQGEYGIELEAGTEDRVVAALDVLKDKLVKRGVSLKALDAGEPRASGKVYKISATLQNGLTSEQAKKVAKVIRDSGPKGVKAQVQGDEVRVQSKKRDDLQETIALLKSEDFDFAVQFVNYR